MHQFIPASTDTFSCDRSRDPIANSDRSPNRSSLSKCSGPERVRLLRGENGQGSATVYRYEIRPHYNWTSSSWNSPREQVAASQPLELQNGYTKEKPGEGNTFLIIFVCIVNVGTKAMYAPSAKQFVVYSDGKMYNYTSVHSSDVLIDNVSGKQYTNPVGQGGTVGSIQPGESNRADGYLIYEIPASFSPGTTYVLCNLDNQSQAAWKLS